MSGMTLAARLCAVAVVSVVSVSAEAALSCPFADGNGGASGVCIEGQGTWQASLQARNWAGNGVGVDAYYDPYLDITWLADANFAQTSGFDADGIMNFSDANAWAAGLTLFGGSDWRLPTLTPVDDTGTFIPAFSDNGSTDVGHANTGVGWGEDSEMTYIYYVHLANDPFGPYSNTGPFANLLSGCYWTSLPFGSEGIWCYDFGDGIVASYYFSGSRAWAVHSGDLIGPAPVPLPGAVWLLGSALVGVGARARRRRP